MKYDAVLFDLDGTLVDNMMVHHGIWQQFLSQLGLEMTIDEVLEKVHGINIEIIENLFPNQYSLEERIALGNQKEELYRTQFAGKLELIDGANEFLATLKNQNIPMGIGTAGPKANCFFALDGLGITHYFDSIIYSELVEKGKPNPEVYEKVANELGVDLKNCVVFEDSPTGALAASNGGADVIVITTTHQPKEFEHIKNVVQFIDDYFGLIVTKV